MEKRFEIGDYVRILGKIDGCPLNSSNFKIGDCGYIGYICEHGNLQYGGTYAWLSYELGQSSIGLAFYLDHDLEHVNKDGQMSLPLKWR